MADISQFLLARVAEEDAAREGSVYYSMPHPTTGERMLFGTEAEVAETRQSRWWRKSVAESWSKRWIIGLHADDGEGCCVRCRFDCEQWTNEPYLYPCSTLCALAVPYAEHPDYEPTWAFGAGAAPSLLRLVDGGTPQ